jgi:two-component system sensor histidine kinase MprB
MNLRTRFALAFAAIAAVVAGLVGLLSYNAAADRITSELDRTLRTATTALENGQDGVLAAPAPATRLKVVVNAGTGSTSNANWSLNP